MKIKKSPFVSVHCEQPLNVYSIIERLNIVNVSFFCAPFTDSQYHAKCTVLIKSLLNENVKKDMREKTKS
jgi:hypothetical protein